MISAQRILAYSTDKHSCTVHSKSCAVRNSECYGPIQAAHLEPVGAGNNREDVSFRHFSEVPLCLGHHTEQEGNTTVFNLKYNTDLWRYALQLTIETLTGVEACFHNDKGMV